MTPTHIFSPLDIALADSVRLRVHFPTMTEAGCRCRICGILWPTSAAWAADNGVCAGMIRGDQSVPEVAR